MLHCVEAVRSTKTGLTLRQFVKFGLTTSAFRSYVPLITREARLMFSKDAAHKRFASTSGTVNLPPVMAELTIYTASRSLQGKEVRERFDSTFADLYHDLDMGFSPINFALPWAPLPHNRKRDIAQRKMAETYMSIIEQRRKDGDLTSEDREEDMIWNLMNCAYKDGTPVPDREVAHMMIALLMAGQHSSSSTITWIFLRLATRPEIQDDLLQEQKDVIGVNEDGTIKELTYDDLTGLPLHSQTIKETLRLHAPIHSQLRKVKQPLAIEGTPYVVPTTHSLLAAPGVTSRTPEHFPEPMLWEPHRWNDEPSERTRSPVSRAYQGRCDGGDRRLWLWSGIKGSRFTVPAFWSWTASMHRRAICLRTAADDLGDFNPRFQVLQPTR